MKSFPLFVLGLALPGCDAPSRSNPASDDRLALAAEALEWTSVLDRGAKGDGITDDGPAFQAAVDAGGIVLVPATANGFYVARPIVIRRPTTVIGGVNAHIRSSSETLFWVTSSDVQITNLDLDLRAERAGTAGIYLDSSQQQLTRIGISAITAHGAYSIVADATATANMVTVLRMSRLSADHARGPQLDLSNSWAYLYVKDSSFSYAAEDGIPAGPLVRVTNNQGGILDSVTVSGPTRPELGGGSGGFSFANCWSVWCRECVASGVNGPGFEVSRSSRFMNFTHGASIGNAGPGLSIDGSAIAQIFGFTANNALAGAPGISLTRASMVQLSESQASENGGDGIHIEAAEQVMLSGVTVASNRGWGISESGSNNRVSHVDIGGNGAGPISMSGAGSYLGVADPLIEQYDPGDLRALGADFGEFDLVALLSRPDVVSVQSFGAKGDGVTDDTAAFSAAVASGKTVLVPPSSGPYALGGTVVLRNPVTLFGVGTPRIKTGSETAFWVASSSVLLGGMMVDASSERAGTSVVYLDSSTQALRDVRIREMIDIGGYSAVRDTPSGNPVQNLAVENIMATQPGGPAFVLQSPTSQVSIRELTADHVGTTTPQREPSFTFANVNGGYLEDLNVMGGASGPYDAHATFFLVSGSHRLGLRRVMGDTPENSNAFWFENSTDLYLEDVVGGLTSGTGAVFSNVQRVYGVNLLLRGTAGTGLVSFGLPELTLQNVSLMQLTNPYVGDSAGGPLSTQGGEDILFNNALLPTVSP